MERSLRIDEQVIRHMLMRPDGKGIQEDGCQRSNKVMIIGNLGRDQMRYTPSKPVTSFSVAVSRGWTTSGGERRARNGLMSSPGETG
jgi:hypothetical protein